MSKELKYLYCAVDASHTVIKIGVTEYPHDRQITLNSQYKKRVRMLYLLEFSGKHYESAEILGDTSNFPSCPIEYGARTSQHFNCDMDKIALKFERFFKSKLSEYVVMNSEWFSYCDYRLRYIKRMFAAIARSENTALVRTKLNFFE